MKGLDISVSGSFVPKNVFYGEIKLTCHSVSTTYALLLAVLQQSNISCLWIRALLSLNRAAVQLQLLHASRPSLLKYKLWRALSLTRLDSDRENRSFLTFRQLILGTDL